MKILLFGSRGQVGSQLSNDLKGIGEVYKSSRKDDLACDVSNEPSIRSTIRKLKPNLIVNAAAYTDVDQAEVNQDECLSINAYAPRVMSEEAKILEIPFVHYSTDYVFDGLADYYKSESEITNPISFYGKSKAIAEEYIIKSGADHLILRTSWVYSKKGKNFLKTIMKLLAEKDSLSVIDDQIGAPSGAAFISKYSTSLIKARIANTASSGIYNCVPSGKTSWYEYARYLLQLAYTHKVFSDEIEPIIEPIPSTEYTSLAKRPLNSCLSNTKLSKTIKVSLPHWKIGVEECFKEIYDK